MKPPRGTDTGGLWHTVPIPRNCFFQRRQGMPLERRFFVSLRMTRMRITVERLRDRYARSTQKKGFAMNQSITPTTPEKLLNTNLFALLFGLIAGTSIIIVGLWALKSMPPTADPTPVLMTSEFPFTWLPTNPAGPSDQPARPPTNPNPPADR